MLLQGKTILITGVRNKWSIAWGIAEAAAKFGANLIFTSQTARECEETRRLVSALGNYDVYELDVSSDEAIEKLFDTLQQRSIRLDGMVHAIAGAKAGDLHADFLYTSRGGFASAMDISVYSLVALCRAALPLMNEGASILTLSYLGSERVVPGYNVMGVAKAALEASVRYLANDMGPKGIRVNAISAGPIKTAAARGIQNFSSLLNMIGEKAPLRRGVTAADIGNTGAFLLSELSGGITGEVIYVDSGFNIMAI